ncbi:hypothetical protein BHM03_00013306 [Ensete ventricosum]|nr:hypothetical protein BHM03_00013306 [Ensete ventricosum]
MVSEQRSWHLVALLQPSTTFQTIPTIIMIIDDSHNYHHHYRRNIICSLHQNCIRFQYLHYYCYNFLSKKKLKINGYI